ncbi:MAG: RNA polymerase factor sigma-54, partial [Comamonas sp.]|nr:RNA polymerase factor sigma-54 [Candidatus Comamonas equi]
MKPGLSLRVSQHLALTPQLQQSIRLLQLSTLELSQEVEQMLDDNPFLEVVNDDLAHDVPGAAPDAAPESDAYAADEASYSIADGPSAASAEGQKEQDSPLPDTDVPSDWEGDGSVDMAADDSEWGGDAPARGNRNDDDDAPTALDLAGAHESLTDHLLQQSLSLRLSELDRYALRFLIENLNDDGYLEDSLEELAVGLAGSDDLEQLEELVHRFTVALR